MANADGIKVAVEKAAHNALREVAQNLWREYGIALQSAHFSWIDASTHSEPDMILCDVRAETFTKA